MVNIVAVKSKSLMTLDRVLSRLQGPGIDLADLYFEHSRGESWSLEDGIVKEGVYSIDQGVGVRAVTGERTGFAYSDQLDEESLQDAVAAARGIARAQVNCGASRSAIVTSTASWLRSPRVTNRVREVIGARKRP